MIIFQNPPQSPYMKTPRGPYNRHTDSELLNEAVAAVRNKKLSLRQAQERTGISRSTLHRAVQKIERSERELNELRQTFSDDLQGNSSNIPQTEHSAKNLNSTI